MSSNSRHLYVSSALLLLVCTLRESLQLSTPESPTYTAAVVEFQPQITDNGVLANLAGYRDLILSEGASNADIIVFPECTLNDEKSLTYVPDPTSNIAPCGQTDKYAKFLADISCHARSSKKYVVINISEKEDCTPEKQAERKDERPCAKDGITQYNTNVVFDRSGVVVARYRKWHLYNEDKNTTAAPELSTFTTDFGVTFGQFVCFDILFQTPAMDMVAQGVTDFIFPSMWFSELPFLTAVQIQQSWAYGNNVNLLAAGASNPKEGSTGTGIYAAQNGGLVQVMNSSPERKLYVATIPKIQKSSRAARLLPTPPLSLNNATARAVTKSDDLVLIQDATLKLYKLEPLNLSKSKTSTKVCHNDFCCTIDIEFTKNQVEGEHKAYQYHAVVYSGLRTYQGAGENWLRTCGIVACTDATAESCGQVFKEASGAVAADYTFTAISIQATFPKKEKPALLMPNSLTTGILPLSVEDFSFDKIDTGKSFNVEYKLTKPQSELLTFAIYGNYLDNASAIPAVSGVLLVVALLARFLY